MPRFRYRAEKSTGEEVVGELAAADAAAARQQLDAAGLRSIHLQPVAEPTEAKPVRLNVAEAQEVLGHVADLGKAKLPLVAGLRAAAAGATHQRVAATLLRLADQIDRGESLESALAASARGFPHYLAGLTHAAARTGRLGLALEDLINFQRAARRIRWNLFGSLLYPALVLTLAMAILLLLLLTVVPTFKVMFDEFELNLPTATVFVVNVSDAAVYVFEGIRKWFTFGTLLFLVALTVILRLALGAPLWRRLWSTVPILGPLWAWTGAAAFAKLLGILVDEGLPLPEALRLTAEGVEDPNVRQACHAYASAVDHGMGLAQSLRRGRHLPETLYPFVSWGEQTGRLAEALCTASDIYFERLRLRAALLRSISPPVIFVFVAIAVGVCLAGTLLPLFSLIQGLS